MWLAVRDVLGPPVAVFLDGAHEFIADAHGVIRILEENRAVRIAINGAVVALLDQHVRFALFLHLAFNELDDVRVVDIEDHHLRRAPCLAAALDHPGERIETLHKADGTRSDAAPLSVSLLPRSEEKLVPVPEPHLKSMPSVLARSMMDP